MTEEFVIPAAALEGHERLALSVTSSVENTHESIEAALRPLIVDDDTAAEVYSSLHDVAWVTLASRATTYSEAFDLATDQGERCFTWSWRAVGDFVAEARGKGENYMDVRFDLNVVSGTVSERVRQVMESLGPRPVL